MNGYDVLLYNPRGEYITRLNSFTSLNMVRTENQTGTLSIVHPIKGNIETILARDCTIDVVHRAGSRAMLLGDTHFLLRKWSFGDNDVALELKDGIDILDRPVVAYDADEPQCTYDAEIADDAMKMVVFENLGASAVEADRNISDWLEVQPYLNMGPMISKEFSGRRVLAVLQEFAKAALEEGIYVSFDVVANGNGKFLFKTFTEMRGVDHSYPNGVPPIIFSTERNNIALGSRLTYDYTQERTYVYARGKDAADNVVYGTAYDQKRISASPFNRIEEWANTQATKQDSADKDAGAVLSEGRPRIVFEGEAQQTTDCMFGVHYNFGDLVTVQSHGAELKCRFRTMNVSVSAKGETLGLILSNIDVPE
jgi:hypothetical protein